MDADNLVRRASLKLRENGARSFVYTAVRFVAGICLSERSVQHYYTRIRYLRQRVKYDAVASPYKTIRVEPSEIKFQNRQHRFGNPGLGKIVTCNWDLPPNRTLLREHYIYKGLRQRFEEGYDWPKTAYYKRAKQEFDTKGSKWGYESLEQFLSIRCGYVDDLYDEIRRTGYQSNAELEHSVPEKDGYRKERNHIHRLEPLVAIGRDGELFLAEGFHRVTIADILDLDDIPVNVLARHRLWQKKRSEVAQGTAREEYDNHPDLEALRNDSIPK